MFALEVALLTGRYVATEYNDRGRAEWPPHPARLFSALVAALFENDPVVPAEREALEWLEQLPAPALVASEAARREVVSTFVPVNDSTVLRGEHSELAKASLTLELVSAAAAGSTGGPGKKAQKARASAEKALAAAVAKFLAPPSAKERSAGAAKEAGRVLPEGRVKQPRTFPSVCPERPVVSFIWPEASATDMQLSAIDGLAARIVRLGHSSSLVSARVASRCADPTHVPDRGGDLVLRVPSAGQTERLAAYFSMHGETLPRVMPASHEAYRRVGAGSPPVIHETTFDDEWIVLARLGGPRLPSHRALDVALAVRGALLKHAPQPVAAVLSGHGSDGMPLEAPHLAIVPLPFVGRQHADGSILGVALVLPRAAGPAERDAVFAALAGWELSHGDAQDPILRVMLGRAGVLELAIGAEVPRLSTLRASTWRGPARRWASVSPVALDRNPGDLRSRDPGEAARAAAEAAAGVALACERIGLPAPTRVDVVPFAPVIGCEKARTHSPFPRDRTRTQRVLTHVLLEFGELVTGPVLLGAGRYLGLGLLRPASDLDDSTS